MIVIVINSVVSKDYLIYVYIEVGLVMCGRI